MSVICNAMLKKILFFQLFIFYTTMITAQTCGCKDIQAINFNPDATKADGSCIYKEKIYTPNSLQKLPPKLKETSGVISIMGKLYTHNDSGNKNELYEISEESDSIIHTIKIYGANEKSDWEDICADNNYIYINDAGNNKGDRLNLNILRIPISQLSQDSIKAESIFFKYPDQTSFTKAKHNHNFDCEAIFTSNDTLHILTKNWANFKTKHYTIPAQPGVYIAKLVDSFDVDMLVTGADISADKKQIVLCGYHKDGNAYIYLLWNFEPNHIFSGNKRRIVIGQTTEVGQIEGVCFKNNDYIYLTNEEFLNSVDQQLWGLDIFDIISGLGNSTVENAYVEDINIYPNIADHFVNAEIVCTKDFTANLYIYNEKKEMVSIIKDKKMTNGYNQIKLNLEELRKGTYLILAKSNNQIVIRNKFSIK